MGSITGSVKGFGVTFSHLFRKVVTTEYPSSTPMSGAAVPRPAHPQPSPRRVGEVHRLRAVRGACPADAIFVQGCDEHRGEPVLPGERYAAHVPDQLRPVHLLWTVHRGLPDPFADHEQRVRAGPRQPAAGPGSSPRSSCWLRCCRGWSSRRTRCGWVISEKDYYLGAPDQPGHVRRCRNGRRFRLDGRSAMTTLVAAAAQVGAGEAWTFWILRPARPTLAALGWSPPRNAVHSALWLVLVMLCLGVFYVVQAGPFIGLAQIIVYTGAIMMLFLFVLMLVGRDATDSLIEVLRGQRMAAVLLSASASPGWSVRRPSRALDGRPSVDLAQANANGATGRAGRGCVHQVRVRLRGDLGPARSPPRSARCCWRTWNAARARRSTSRTGCGPGSRRATTPGPRPVRACTPPRRRWPRPACLPDGRLADQTVSPILPRRELTWRRTRRRSHRGR